MIPIDILPSSVIIMQRECEKMQNPTARFEVSMGFLPLELQEPWGRGENRLWNQKLLQQGGNMAWELTESEMSIPEHIWVCGRSSVCMFWLLAWCFAGTPGSVSGVISDSFTYFWEPIFPILLPCLAVMWGFMPDLIGFCTVFIDILCVCVGGGGDSLFWDSMGGIDLWAEEG